MKVTNSKITNFFLVTVFLHLPAVYPVQANECVSCYGPLRPNVIRAEEFLAFSLISQLPMKTCSD